MVSIPSPPSIESLLLVLSRLSLLDVPETVATNLSSWVILLIKASPLPLFVCPSRSPDVEPVI